jgi:hypothetical protein
VADDPAERSVADRIRKWPIAEYRRKAVDLLALVGLGAIRRRISL